MEQDPETPLTFWLQPPQTTTRHRKPPIDPVVLIILIPIVALIFLFFFLPQFLSHTSHILKPASVKSSWDSRHIFLVLFAILCGVLALRNDDVSSSNENGFVVDSNSSNDNNSAGDSSGQWIGFSEQRVVSGGLRRSSSSYPDLKQESLWVNDDFCNRFYDDLSTVSRYYNNLSRPIAAEAEFSGDNYRRSLRSEEDLVEVSDVKDIVVDTFEISQNDPATPPPPPPPPPHPLVSAKSKRHSFRSVGRKIESDEFEKVKNYPPPPRPPPPPPPALSSMEVRVNRSRQKHTKLERKVSDASKEIATAISSLYNQKKRKHKWKLRSISISSDSSPPSVHFESPEAENLRQLATRPPPPPPPLRPPPFMFQNLFKKGGKHKRIHSVSPVVSITVSPHPPTSILNNIFKSGSKSKCLLSTSTPPSPPLPPPPPSSIMNNLFKTGTKSKRFNSSPPLPPPSPPPMTPPRRYIIPVKSKKLPEGKTQIQPQTFPESEPLNRRYNSKGKPPLPLKTSYYERDQYLPSGSQSPLIPTAPPPPPPPFRMSAMKFELHGDFVRIRSTHSSVCSSPNRDDVDLTTNVVNGENSIGPGWGSGSGPSFFPSPDVNTKADIFISRLKDEWRMEKINHVKRENGLKPIN